MSDPLSELPRPPRSPTWRERLTEWAETLDLSPTRLAVGAAGLVVVGLVGWKLLAPPAPPPEMRLPFVSTTTSGGPEGSAPADPADPAAAGATGTTEPGDVSEVVVHVAGAVGAPGVHRLATGARVVDAVDAAGGALTEADLSRLNLAAPLEDGQQVYVPRVGEVPPVVAGAADGSPTGGEQPGEVDGGPVDVNTATAGELEALPGVGPSIAQAIVAYREEHGRFSSVDQLIEVRGIGDARLEQLRPLVTV
jgi:competence protein ComEA